MDIQTFNLVTTDGLRLYGRHWPVPDARAVMGLVHGLGEHVGRYDHLAAYFHQAGIAVMGLDRRGHGRSEGRRGHAPDYSHLLDEIDLLLAEMQEQYPEKPLLLYGHSQGGNLVLNYLFDRRPAVSAVIATGPWVRLAFQPSPVLVGLARLMRRILPALAQSNGLDPEDLSRDPSVVKAYQADPLVHDRITSGMAVAMMEAAARLDALSAESPAPLLLMHGAADRITDPAATQELAGRLTGAVVHRIWPELRHEIHNEPEQEEVMAYCRQWINDQLPGGENGEK